MYLRKKAYCVQIFFFLSLSIIDITAYCQSQAVKSANGFICSVDEHLVHCHGNFPGHPYPFIGSTGYNSVMILSEYENYRWTYDSESGCICRYNFVGPNRTTLLEYCISSLGNKRSFPGEFLSRAMKAGEWCRKE